MAKVLPMVLVLGIPSAAAVNWSALTATTLGALPAADFSSTSNSGFGSQALKSIPYAACAGFTAQQIQEIKDLSYSICSGFSSDCIAELVPSAFASLQIDCALGLTPTALSAMKADQLAAFPPEHINDLLLHTLANIPSASCSGFSQAQTKELGSGDGGDVLGTCEGFTADCLHMVPASAFAGFQWPCTSCLNASALSKISAPQLSAVPPTSLNALNVPTLRALNASACSGLTRAQLQGISPPSDGTSTCEGFTADCLQDVPAASFAGIQRKCVGLLGPDALSKIGAAQLAEIPGNSLGMIDAVTLQNLSPAVCVALSATQVSNISGNSCQGFVGPCLLNIPTASYQGFQNECVTAIPSPSWLNVSLPQLMNMTRMAIGGLTSDGWVTLVSANHDLPHLISVAKIQDALILPPFPGIPAPASSFAEAVYYGYLGSDFVKPVYSAEAPELSWLMIAVCSPDSVAPQGALFSADAGKVLAASKDPTVDLPRAFYGLRPDILQKIDADFFATFDYRMAGTSGLSGLGSAMLGILSATQVGAIPPSALWDSDLDDPSSKPPAFDIIPGLQNSTFFGLTGDQVTGKGSSATADAVVDFWLSTSTFSCGQLSQLSLDALFGLASLQEGLVSCIWSTNACPDVPERFTDPKCPAGMGGGTNHGVGAFTCTFTCNTKRGTWYDIGHGDSCSPNATGRCTIKGPPEGCGFGPGNRTFEQYSCSGSWTDTPITFPPGSPGDGRVIGIIIGCAVGGALMVFLVYWFSVRKTPSPKSYASLGGINSGSSNYGSTSSS